MGSGSIIDLFGVEILEKLSNSCDLLTKGDLNAPMFAIQFRSGGRRNIKSCFLSLPRGHALR